MAAKSNADGRKPAVRVRAGTLASALKDVRDAVAGKNTIPILSMVLLRAGDGKIALSATDLDQWVVRDLASDDRDGAASKEWIESIRGFSAALPARALSDIVGGFDADAMVTITGPTPDEPRAIVAGGRSRFKLACLPAEEFPTPPPISVAHEFEMPATRLLDAVASIDFAVSTEETRYYLNGIYLHTDQLPGEPQVLKMAATDGHRLARLILDVLEGAAALPGIIVPRVPLRQLERLLQEAVKAAGEQKVASVHVEINEGGDRLQFTMGTADDGEVMLVTKAIDGTFPDYGRVIPLGNEKRATLNREQLIGAIKRVAVLTTKESSAVKASFADGTLTLSVSNPELGQAEEEIACEWVGVPLEIGFNGRYWRECLGAIAQDNVTMHLQDAGGPTLIVGADDDAGPASRYVQVLMPMRV